CLDFYCPLQRTCRPVAQTSCEQMANAEVSIPVGDVVVVPTEGTEGGNPEDTKTQVILQLQPVQQGRIYQEGSETNAAMMAVETHTIHKLEDGIGSITQIAVSDESVEEGIEWNSAMTAAVTMATDEGIKKDPEEISEEMLMFWKGIADVGLMEEVVCNIQKEIEEVLRGVQQRLAQSPFQITGG
ncbi:hypothetical protein E2320_000463, partial [Naja naja]